MLDNDYRNGASSGEEKSGTTSISTHDFEEAKGKIKQFTDQMPSNPTFRPFPVAGGLFNWFPHNVTGDELNSFVKSLEKHMIDFNRNQIAFLKEFGHVYEAFESLDRDYIQAILIAVKSAEKASTEAKDAQRDIDITVDRLCQTVESYKRFKSKVESYEHLEDTDQMWNELRVIKQYVEKHGEITEDQNEQIRNLTNQNRVLSRKVTLMTILSACAVGFVICDVILHLTGVL